MKRLLWGAAVLLAFVAPAAAADLPARTYTKAPAYVAAVYDWSGFYVGANGGWGTSRECWTNTALGGVPTIPTVNEGCHDASGGTFGGQIGYRWQSSAWVFGLEAQGNWADFRGSNISLPSLGLLTNRTKVDSLGLFTGQVGYAWNNALLYLKGGAAVTHDKYTGSILGVDVDSTRETRWGATVGTGIEYGFAPNWSAALEYDHLFMGRRNDTFTVIGAPGVVTRTDSIRQDVDMITARINYRWGGPVVAKY
jgi:outer membrane immunogenic protein